MQRTSIVFGIVVLLAAPAFAQSSGGNGGGGGGGSSGAGADPASVFAVHQQQLSATSRKSPNDRGSRYRGRQQYKVSCDGGLDYPAWYTIGGCRSYGAAQ